MNRRKRLVIDKLQIQLIITIVGLVIGVSAILAALVFHLVDVNMTNMGFSENIKNDLFSLTLIPIMITALIIYIIMIWFTVLITNKIYGPLNRLSHYIKRLSQGEKTDEIQFRKGDAINGLREMYNSLRSNIEKTLTYNYQEMSNIFSDLENILDEISVRKLTNQQISEQLQKITSRLAKALDITSEAIEKEKN